MCRNTDLIQDGTKFVTHGNKRQEGNRLPSFTVREHFLSDLVKIRCQGTSQLVLCIITALDMDRGDIEL